MRFILLILSIVLLASCRSTRTVQKETIIRDSTAIREVATLKRVIKDTVANYERQLSQLSETGVVFETRTDTVRIPGKIEYYDNGRIKSVEGALKSVNQRLQEEVAEKYNYAATIDSLMQVNDSLATNVRVETKTVEKQVKRGGFPWFWVILTAVVTLVVRWKLWPYIVKLYKHLRG